MKIQPVAEWRRMHRLTSVRISAFMAMVFAFGPALLSAWTSLPHDLKEALPHGWSRVIAILGFVLVVAAQLFCKTERRPPREGDDHAAE